MKDSIVKVALHGVPRSGTSWIGEILNSSPYTCYCYQPLFSYSFKDYLTPSSSLKDIDNFFSEISKTDDDFVKQLKKRELGAFPDFKKESSTHIVYKEVRYINILLNLMRKSSDLHLCALIRNPLGVIDSWLRAPREFRADLGWSELDEWRYALKKNINKPEEYNGYEKWKEAAFIFHHLKTKYPERVHILKYIDFVKNPYQEASLLFKKLGLVMTESTKNFLDMSTSRTSTDPYSVYRDVQDDIKWKKHLNPIIVEQVYKDLEGSFLREYLL
jgi:hypothetical protein